MKDITLEKIKEFAYSQLGSENPAVSVTDGEFAIVDPWYSPTLRKDLDDEGAKKEWGEDVVNEFIEKARDYLSKQKKHMMDRRTAAYLVENIHEKSTFQFEQCEKCGAIYLPKLGHNCEDAFEVEVHDIKQGDVIEFPSRT